MVVQLGEKMETVNIVATGELNLDELDIEELYYDMDEDISNLSPGRLDLQFDNKTPLIMIYPAGTFTIPGASSVDELYNVRDRFKQYLDEISGGRLSEISFSIKYMVFMSDFGKQINLETLALELGLENIEYEPEQFPGLIYRVDNPAGVVLIFSSGKVLYTGFKNEEKANEVEDRLRRRSDRLS